MIPLAIIKWAVVFNLHNSPIIETDLWRFGVVYSRASSEYDRAIEYVRYIRLNRDHLFHGREWVHDIWLAEAERCCSVWREMWRASCYWRDWEEARNALAEATVDEYDPDSRFCFRTSDGNWIADPEYYRQDLIDSLTQLRTIIGPSAYYRGELPPSWPLWLFRRIDER